MINRDGGIRKVINLVKPSRRNKNRLPLLLNLLLHPQLDKVVPCRRGPFANIKVGVGAKSVREERLEGGRAGGGEECPEFTTVDIGRDRVGEVYGFRRVNNHDRRKEEGTNKRLDGQVCSFYFLPCTALISPVCKGMGMGRTTNRKSPLSAEA